MRRATPSEWLSSLMNAQMITHRAAGVEAHSIQGVTRERQSVLMAVFYFDMASYTVKVAVLSVMSAQVSGDVAAGMEAQFMHAVPRERWPAHGRILLQCGLLHCKRMIPWFCKPVPLSLSVSHNDSDCRCGGSVPAGSCQGMLTGAHCSVLPRCLLHTKSGCQRPGRALQQCP